jgi:hypothetical protein
MYITYVKPFEIPLLNYMEVFNEVCVLIATYHLFLFTDFVPDPELRYSIGWSIIGVTIVNIIVNMLVMFWSTIKQLRLMFKKLIAHYQKWKDASKAKKGVAADDSQKNKTEQLKVEDLEHQASQQVPLKKNKSKTGRSASKKLKIISTPTKTSRTGWKGKDEMPAAKPRVTSLDDIRREYNKNLTDFKSFEDYQLYMEERTLKVL